MKNLKGKHVLIFSQGYEVVFIRGELTRRGALVTQERDTELAHRRARSQRFYAIIIDLGNIATYLSVQQTFLGFKDVFDDVRIIFIGATGPNNMGHSEGVRALTETLRIPRVMPNDLSQSAYAISIADAI